MLVKQSIDISFAQGLDTKTDHKRVQIGKFLSLENTVFDKGGLLQKRNGYGALATLPNSSYSYLTTFNGNLTAIGSNIAALNTAGATYVARGEIAPMSVSTLPLIRNNLNQTACDAAVAPNGLVCTVYLESNGSSVVNKYAIADSVTGQNLVAPTIIPVASGTVSGGMRVFVLANNFIMIFTNTIGGSAHLQYVAVSINNPTIISANIDIAAGYTPATTLSWDGFVAGSNLYIAYNTTSGGQSIKVTYLSRSLGAPVSPATFSGAVASIVSVTADTTGISPVIYVSYWASTGPLAAVLAVDQNLNVLLAPAGLTAAANIVNLASAAQNGSVMIFIEMTDAYYSGSGLPTNFVKFFNVTLAGAQTAGISLRSVGLGSKAFIVNGQIYYLAAYSSSFQPTYFLVNGSLSTSAAPVIAGKLAYENGGGYLTLGLPGISISGTTAALPYLYKDLIEAVNKNTAVPAGSQTAGIYSQTGINLGRFDFGTQGLDTAEIGGDLHLSGGFLWMYDGYLPVEHNFFLWPDSTAAANSTEAVWSTTGGAIHAQPDNSTNNNAYYYQITYEWTDNQGNAFRSAPSIPIAVTTTGSVTTGSILITVPTLRITMKTANPVKIVIYRWSVAQEEYYQVTSISSPLLNDPTIDELTFTDTLADPSILGNNLIYTTGGIIEDVNAPASNLLTLFDTRLWLVDAEDPNLLWFSKQVIEATPVEMSDLLTLYVPPTTASQGSTGPITALAVMDDKLIIFKKDTIYYINGTGPDNTGLNNQYSPVTFITSSVGCANQKSIALMPMGLMFQSDKGIWLLGRGLDTEYIGAPVEDFTLTASVNSAVGVPETNQVRFTLDSGITLMYDYYYAQWGTFVGVSAISSCIFQGLHTFINQYGAVYQEAPGLYVDGSNPVLIQFQTGPLRLDQLQSYQRAYFFYILGTYISPHKLMCSITYDYEAGPSHSVLITPNNYGTAYGSGPSQSPYGQGTPYGGPSNLEIWRVFLDRQRCMAISITLQEIYDATFGVAAGAGLTISGLNVVCGFKKGFHPQSAATSVG